MWPRPDQPPPASHRPSVPPHPSVPGSVLPSPPAPRSHLQPASLPRPVFPLALQSRPPFHRPSAPRKVRPFLPRFLPAPRFHLVLPSPPARPFLPPFHHPSAPRKVRPFLPRSASVSVRPSPLQPQFPQVHLSLLVPLFPPRSPRLSVLRKAPASVPRFPRRLQSGPARQSPHPSRHLLARQKVRQFHLRSAPAPLFPPVHQSPLRFHLP